MDQKVYAYIRRKDRDTPETVMKQQEAIKRYCNQHGIHEMDFIIDSSAEKCVLDREGYIIMKEKIKHDTEHKIMVCFSDWSRLTRDITEMIKVKEELEKLGASCKSADEGPASSWELALLTALPDQVNPDYLDSEDEDEDLFPRLLSISPLDNARTALFMSDQKIYQIQNEEIGELLGLDFKAEYCSIGDKGRKIVMEAFDRRFPVAGIKGFMRPLPLNEHIVCDE